MVQDSNEDAFWVWQATVIFFTFLGLIGLSLIEAGSVRQKSSLFALMKNFVQMSVGILVWWLLGFGFGLGDTEDDFIGNDKFGGEDWEGTYHYNRAAIYGLLGIFVVFVVNGALAERLQMWVSVSVAFWMMVWVYPVIVAWEWGEGWLNDLDPSFIDRAGSGSIHLLAGSFAFMGLILTGPRIGRFQSATVPHGGSDHTESPESFIPNSFEMVSGGYLLVFLAVMAISGFRSSDFIDIQAAVFNSLLAGSASSIASTILYTLGSRSVDFHYEAILQGFLAGEIAVASVARDCEPWAAFCIGLIAAVLFSGTARVVRRLKIDDVTNVVAVHYMNGIWGVIAVAFFDDEKGVFHDNDGDVVGSQVVGAVVITFWGFFWALVFIGFPKIIRRLRVPQELEILGLNYAKIKVKGYAIEGDSAISPDHQGEKLH
jgi:Amt family ammonium transporter